jgi:hypothetical protein
LEVGGIVPIENVPCAQGYSLEHQNISGEPPMNAHEHYAQRGKALVTPIRREPRREQHAT